MANIAIFRINYKSDFILTLNSDAGWMTPFCIKFWTGAPSQAYFVGYDGTTYTHCAPVAGDPTKLEVQFDDHHLPIGDLKFQIGYHFTVADFPTAVEDEVINQAAAIIDQDGTPMQVMLDLNGETAPEIQFSLPAYANEAQRIANEEQRIAAEAIRIVNEESRIAAETIRQQNEAQRIAQETARVNEFATLKAQSQAATSAANTAAALANEKAQLAADKAALAGAAATLANAKAQLAADKAALADAAATLANDKAALAQQKAEYAQQQGGYAKDQGDYAKNQGDYAKEQVEIAQADHERAEADHGIAVDDHTQAGNDHTRAESDHGIAVDDHTQAGNDHTRAESDHGIAVDDHTQAGNDHTRAESDHGIADDDHTQAGNDHTRAESDHTRAESDHDAVELYVDSLGAFDISAYHATGGVLAKYADLTAALGTNGANIPDTLRKGGMSVKFVHSVDNKYTRYNLLADSFTTDTTQWAIDDGGIYVENPEFIKSETDSEGKVVWAIRTNGTIYFGAGVPQQVVDYINEKIAELSLDEYEDIVAFLNGLESGEKTLSQLLAEKADAETVITALATKIDKVEGKSLIDEDVANGIHYEENPEYTEAKTDSEGKLLAGRTFDGTAFENVGFSTPKVSIKGHIIENIEDPEGRSEITTDAEGKIISYRDSNGVKHENVGIETSNLNFTGTGLSDLAKDLKEVGIGVTNWSDKKELHIEEPYCAMVNFSGIDNIPQVKYSDDNRPHAYMQFWDMNGNYFKKEVLINAQGRSTMAHPKKNIAIDICNNNGWDDDDTFNLQIGDWIPQDSFHLKAFYNDPFRCLSPVAYKLNDEVLKSRGEFNDYVWKRALLDLGDVTATSTGCETAEDAIDGWNTNARCFPMGFPCIVYLNGEYYGIYSWQLKKHRDNYMMSKKKTKHIHLDGIISLDRILNANGDTTKIWWTTNSPEGVEIRNPKPKKKKDGWDLVLLNGEKYDADANGGEIMSPTMVVEGAEVANPNWNPDDASHVKSYEVKQYILNMSKIIPTLADAYNTYEESAKTSEDKTAFKEVFEAYFDVDNLIDYLILSDVLANYDGFSQNVQWITYNGVKWYLCAYDMDGVMGNWWELNNTIVAPRSAHYDYAQFQYLPIFYNNELETRYKELRDKNIISVENISGLVEYWLKRIGAKETFDKEWEKWSGFIKNDNVHRLYKWLQVSILNMDTLYNYNQN